MFDFIKKLTTPFTKIGISLGQKIRSIFSQGYDEEAFRKLERLFYEADLGVAMTSSLLASLRRLVQKQPTLSHESLLEAIRQELLKNIVATTPPPLATPLHVILLAGVNGSGKTTTLAKLAYFYHTQGKKVRIAAADTFRAAAIDQLTLWAEKIGVACTRAQPGSDPSSVVFDALHAAKARGDELVLIDTAGRLQTKTDLMQELSKIGRVCRKQVENAPHETLLVLDATGGQNSLDQTKIFHQFLPITGLILSKLDGTAKGGALLAIQKELALPIQWIGTGETVEELAPFSKEHFIDLLLKESPLGSIKQ